MNNQAIANEAAARRTEPTRAAPLYRPLVDIQETAEELVLRADVPGASRDAIDIKFENGVLELHAKAKPRQPEGTTYLAREYAVGDYYRTFEVHESIDAAKIWAEYGQGVLTLHLPKAEKVKPRKIEIKSS